MCQNLYLLMFMYFHFERAEAERRKREEAERKAKLDEILEKQRQRERELEEKAERQKREMLARPLVEPRPVEPAVPAPAAPIAVTTAPAPGRYVPRHRRQEAAAAQVAAEPDRRGIRPDDRPALSSDRWRSDRSDERRPSPFGVGSKSTWSSSRPR